MPIADLGGSESRGNSSLWFKLIAQTTARFAAHAQVELPRTHNVIHNRPMGMIADGLELVKLANIGANAEIHEKLGKFVEKAQELQAKVETLEEQNKELREQLLFKGMVVRIGGQVYVNGDDEPICSRCADVDNRPVHLRTHEDPKLGKIVICPHCKGHVSRYLMPRSHIEKLVADGRPITLT
jgi:hypothetical protein